MTALLRCRGALSEIGKQFDTAVPDKLDWTPVIWPGEPVLIIREQDGARRIELRSWGLPLSAYANPPKTPAGRAVAFPRMLAADAGHFMEPAKLEHCLIVAEAFAYPTGEPGKQRRAWAGLWDAPLFSWAGVCPRDTGSGCAGLLGAATPTVSRVSSVMPIILAPGDYGRWLGGRTGLLSLAPVYDDEAIFLEEGDELWSTGAIEEE